MMKPAAVSSAPWRTFQADALSVRVHQTGAGLALDAAEQTREYLRQCLAEKGAAAAVLATGNSQIRFLETLAGLGGVDWAKVTLFHMDEYLGIDAKHPGSFRHYMRERVELRLRPNKFHYIEGDALLPLAEC